MWLSVIALNTIVRLQQATIVMDQARDFVKRVGESVGNIVEGGSGTTSDANK